MVLVEPVVRVVVVVACPPPCGIVIVRLSWLEFRVRAGVADVVGMFRIRDIVARVRRGRMKSLEKGLDVLGFLDSLDTAVVSLENLDSLGCEDQGDDL